MEERPLSLLDVTEGTLSYSTNMLLSLSLLRKNDDNHSIKAGPQAGPVPGARHTPIVALTASLTRTALLGTLHRFGN